MWNVSDQRSQEYAALAAAIPRISDGELRSAMTEALLSFDNGTHQAVEPEARGFDVLVLAVKPVELEACLTVFGVDRRQPPFVIGHTGLCGWTTCVNGSDILISMVGSAGNVQTAVVMNELKTSFNLRCAALVGMAAGLEGKVSLGDVVVAEQILEYEFARMTVDGPMYQPRPTPVSPRYLRSAELVSRNASDWTAKCRAFAIEASTRTTEASVNDRTLGVWQPRVHLGVVLAGAKLLEDGSLPQLQLDLHDRVRAAEMEGAGFSAVCEAAEVDWMVVRGIADFGKPKRAKNWQLPSTVAAANYVRETLLQGLAP